jgi:hypothetical protein
LAARTSPKTLREFRQFVGKRRDDCCRRAVSYCAPSVAT